MSHLRNFDPEIADAIRGEIKNCLGCRFAFL